LIFFRVSFCFCIYTHFPPSMTLASFTEGLTAVHFVSWCLVMDAQLLVHGIYHGL
jgi:hypothetical protein